MLITMDRVTSSQPWDEPVNRVADFWAQAEQTNAHKLRGFPPETPQKFAGVMIESTRKIIERLEKSWPSMVQPLVRTREKLVLIIRGWISLGHDEPALLLASWYLTKALDGKDNEVEALAEIARLKLEKK